MKFLNQEEKQFYRENGFVVIKNVFEEKEFDEISSEYDAIFKRKSEEDSNLKAIWGGNWKDDVLNNEEKAATESKNLHVKSIHNLQMHSSVFSRLLLNPKLLDAVEDVMDSENIVLHHTKAHLKPPEEGAPFPMHQDYHYFPYENDSMVAIFIHLDDANPENGGLAVFPGSHKLGPLEDKSNEIGFHYIDQNKFKLSEATPLVAKRGDVVIFSYLLVHGSYVNTSDRVRRMLLVQLASADDKPLNEMHKSPGAGLVLRGRNMHQTADLNKRFDGEGKKELDAFFNKK